MFKLQACDPFKSRLQNFHILAKWLEQILPEIIHQTDQTGFIKQCQTQDNIKRTLHLIHETNQEQIEAVIMGLDAEKAFDSVNWSFLYNALQFHKKIIRTIQALYNKPAARMKINGSLLRSFELESGCQQGCPISPLLFALLKSP